MPTIRDAALSYLYKELRAAKNALGRAESKPNVRQEELDNLQAKVDMIDRIIPIVMKMTEEET